jgi:nucleotide-binding universal stress UspA family protein
MKKFVAAIDGLQFSESTRDYAIHLAKQAHAHLVIVSLEDITYQSYKIYELITTKGVSEKKMNLLEEKDAKTRRESVEKMEAACQKAGITYSIHHDRNIALQELLHESIYADLLIIDSKETLTHYSEKTPTRFIRDLLMHVECPVLVVPQKYKPIQKNILLYDGEPTSVNAIKLFSYDLMALKHLETEILTVKNIYQTMHVPDNRLMKEFVKRHFPKAAYKVLKGLPEDEIIDYLKTQSQQTLVVLGAYQRGMISRWFRSSMADILMKELKIPLFMVHSK